MSMASRQGDIAAWVAIRDALFRQHMQALDRLSQALGTAAASGMGRGGGTGLPGSGGGGGTGLPGSGGGQGGGTGLPGGGGGQNQQGNFAAGSIARSFLTGAGFAQLGAALQKGGAPGAAANIAGQFAAFYVDRHLTDAKNIRGAVSKAYEDADVYDDPDRVEKRTRLMGERQAIQNVRDQNNSAIFARSDRTYEAGGKVSQPVGDETKESRQKAEAANIQQQHDIDKALTRERDVTGNMQSELRHIFRGFRDSGVVPSDDMIKGFMPFASTIANANHLMERAIRQQTERVNAGNAVQDSRNR